MLNRFIGQSIRVVIHSCRVCIICKPFLHNKCIHLWYLWLFIYKLIESLNRKLMYLLLNNTKSSTTRVKPRKTRSKYIWWGVVLTEAVSFCYGVVGSILAKYMPTRLFTCTSMKSIPNFNILLCTIFTQQRIHFARDGNYVFTTITGTKDIII